MQCGLRIYQYAVSFSHYSILWGFIFNAQVYFFLGSVPWVLLVACYFESNLILDLINCSFGLATDEVLACYNVKGASGLIMYWKTNCRSNLMFLILCRHLMERSGRSLIVRKLLPWHMLESRVRLPLWPISRIQAWWMKTSDAVQFSFTQRVQRLVIR